MRKKKINLKSIVATTIVSATLLNSVAAFAAGLNNFENGFVIENGIGQSLNNVSGVVNGELKYVYTERDKLIKDEGGTKTLNVIEVGSEEEDDNMEPFSQSADGTTRNKLRYMYGGYKKEPSDPDEFKGFTPFLNSTSNPTEPTTIKELMDFLNFHKNPYMTCNTSYPHSINNTCMFALKNFYNFYCLLLQKDVIGWHSSINRVVDGAKRDISQYFNPITSWNDYTVHVNSTVATGFDDYFEGSLDNEGALGDPTDTFSLEYPIPGAPTPGTYVALRDNNQRTQNIFLGKTSSRSELFFGGDSRQELYTPLKTIIPSKNNQLETTTDVQGATKVALMVNNKDTLNNNNYLDSSTLNKYQLPGIDESIGFRPADPSTPSVITMNKYNVRPNNERKLTRYSNATYFLYPFARDEDGYANPINLYDFDNDGNSCNRETNTYSYGLAFSKKHTRSNGKGLWERAQATIWAGTGNPKFDHIGVSASTVADIEGDETAESTFIDMELDENHDSVTAEGYDPNNIVLYIAGRALDLYENELAKDYGSPSQSAHDKAVEGSTPGTNDNLRNKVIVSTKGLGTIAPDGSTNDDFEASMIGTTADATGTVLVGDGEDQSYLIGPFLMSDYTYAGSEYVVPFSGQDVEKYKPLIGGIVGGELTLTSDMGGEQKVLIGKDIDTEAQIVYETPKGEDYSSDKTEWKAGIPSLTDSAAGSTSGTSGSNTFLQDVDELLDGYEYPRPKSVFYIKVKKSTCGDSDTLKNIRFVYRQTYSDGDGWVIAARYIESTWQANAIEDGCTSGYTCENLPEGVSTSHSDPSPHSMTSCGGERGDYGHTDTCSTYTCGGHGSCSHSCSDPKCTHNCTHTYTWTCNQRVYCTHQYRYCLHTSEYTLIDGATIKKAQPTLALHQTKVDLRDYCYDAEVWVRLTTFVSINKYIYDVEHSPEDGNDAFTTADYNSTYPEALLETEDPTLSAEIAGDYQKVTREKLSENKKNSNPVYVEYGDTVIYHIQLLNYQKKDISLKVKDILPKNSIFLSIENITENMEDIDLSDSKFTPEKTIGSGDEVKLLTDKSVDKNVKLESDNPDERTIVTDWIVVPGTDSPSTPSINGTPNIVTLSVKVMVEEWSNELLYENKAVIVTRNAGPEGEDDWSDDHTIEDYMRVIDNGVEDDPDPSTYGDEFPFAGPDSVPGPVVNLTELETEDRDADMPTPRIVSSDWYILNNYNAFMDKFIYKYDEAMQHENESYKYTKDGYISTPDAGSKDLYYDDMGEDDILVKPRINDNTTEPKTYTLDDSVTTIMLKKYDESEEFDALENKHIDPNIKDTLRNPGDKKDIRYNEVSKKIHPVSVEKLEVVTYAVKVSNEAKIVGKTSETSKTPSGVITADPHLSGSKPATQVRPTKITDYLEEGLELVSVEARIYDEESNTDSPNRKTPDLVDRYSSIDIGSPSASDGATLDIEPDRKYKKIEVNLGDDEIILNPGECIVYFVTVKVRESNMYLNDLQNYAEINILTNINKKTEDGITFDDEYRVVRDEEDEDYNMNIALQEKSSDWVRLKDLVIAGRVWVDFNRDGYMNEDVEKTFTEESLDPGGIKGNGAEIKDKIGEYYSVDNYGRKQGVDVKLYKVEGNTAKLLRTTQTDETGLYTFATETGGDNNLVSRNSMEYYNDYNYDAMPKGNIVEFEENCKWYQRVDKATEKDEYGNYTDNSKYIEYYVEFEYDGVVYRSTEFYSGEDNINFTEGENFGKYDDNKEYEDEAALNKKIHNDDGTHGDDYTYKYEVDSNAAEFVDKRKEFNKKFQYISYNVTYSSNDGTNYKGTGTESDLEFDKTGHTSQLLEEKDKNKDRKKMTARSFINNATMAGKHGNEKLPDNPNEKKWYEEKYSSEGTIKETADLLWLCKYGEKEQEYKEDPETEYLKHINLGLELREDVDVDVTKDVYQVKTTVNGEEMVYTYNQNYDRDGISKGILNGDRGDTGDTSAEQGSKAYLNDYIVKRPYGLELYESDYKYRYDQYKAEAVRNYKEDKSELNIEVTYRITISNKSVWDDETLLSSTNPSEKTRKDKDGNEKPEIKDTKLDVKVHEIMDFYDKNFIKYKDSTDSDFNPEKDNKVTVKIKDKDGYLIDKDIIIAEAWFYEKTTGEEVGDDDFIYYIENVNGRGDNPVEKPVYKVLKAGDQVGSEAIGSDIYIRKNLTLKNESGYSKREFAVTPESAGYYKTYISGMDKLENREYFRIPEGQDRDIYVKYVIDKHDGAFNETTNESVYTETSTSIKTITQEGLFEGTHVETASVTKNTIDRALRIAEQIVNKPNPRGTENIAQLNAYSVWYSGTNLEASIVDKDSNVGNVGIKNTDTGSVPNPITEITVDDEDKVPYYEDTVYKTGIEIIANGTENTEEKMSYKGGDIVFRIGDNPITRIISGMVWDDSRSVELTSDKVDKDQYIGNGIYNENDKPNEDAKINDNVKVNYKDDSVTEEKDIKVRNANAEFVEIVEIPPKKGDNTNNSDEPHYYEEILANVTWDQTQHMRTDGDGNYTLRGFMPGKYIVRFTYGDNVEGNADATKDMRVFNGQDYKTTQYAYEMSDYKKTETEGEALAKIVTEENTIDEYATANTESERGNLETNSIDTVLTALERPDLSDARDDEIRRLAVNNYSEIMINKKAEVLKGLANGTELTNKKVDTNGVTAEVNYYNPKQEEYEGSKENTEEQLKELNDNTFMHAETVEFLVKSEKLTYPQTNGTYYGKYIGSEENAMKVYYDLLKNIEFNTVANRDFKIENIDMGIEYRPETAIGLTKEINRIQLITSDDKTLMDLQLKTEYGEKGEIIRHYIDVENSIGSELVQFITNEYIENDLLQGIIQVDDEDIQGFIYLNVDDDILQGCKVVVQYKFVAQNNSEIDRIANTLDEIRFYGNKKTKDLREIYSGKEKTFYLNVEKDLGDLSTVSPAPGSDETPVVTNTSKETTEYTANNFARNMVSTDVYSNDTINGDLYRDRAKTMIDDNSNVAPIITTDSASGTATPSPSTATSSDSESPALSTDPDGTNGYFGKYVGYTYFVGGDSEDDKQQKEKKSKQNNELDVIAELKFDRVIDYVDTDLEYGQLDQKDISKLANNTPVANTEENSSKYENLQGLKNALLNEPINSDIRAVSNQAFANISLRTALDYSNIIRRVNDQLKFATKSNVTNETQLENVLTNIDEIKYKTIVVTVPDREFDPDRKSDENEDTVINEAFSKYLKPSVLDTNKKINSIAEIVLPVSKVLATETDMENMQYENIAEVVQFTVLTGRRTNFDTTVGNADIHYVDKEFEAQGKKYQPIGSIEFVTSLLEPDTSSTETITLTPPTGLMRNRRVIREAVDTTTNVVEIAVIAIAVVVTILIITKVTIVKIKKKRYK